MFLVNNIKESIQISARDIYFLFHMLREYKAYITALWNRPRNEIYHIYIYRVGIIIYICIMVLSNKFSLYEFFWSAGNFEYGRIFLINYNSKKCVLIHKKYMQSITNLLNRFAIKLSLKSTPIPPLKMYTFFVTSITFAIWVDRNIIPGKELRFCSTNRLAIVFFFFFFILAKNDLFFALINFHLCDKSSFFIGKKYQLFICL